MIRRWFIGTLFGVLTILSLRAQVQEPKQSERTPATKVGENPFDKFQEFSATHKGGFTDDPERKMYRSGNLMRFDYSDHYRVAELDNRILWVVYPDKCSKAPALDPGVFPFPRKLHLESSKPVGNETVDGHVCKVEDMVLAGEQLRYRMRLYQAEDLNGFPVKIDVENLSNKLKFEISYTNVSLEKPDPKLFQHPVTCDQKNIPAAAPTTKKPTSHPKP